MLFRNETVNNGATENMTSAKQRKPQSPTWLEGQKEETMLQEVGDGWHCRGWDNPGGAEDTEEMPETLLRQEGLRYLAKPSLPPRIFHHTG